MPGAGVSYSAVYGIAVAGKTDVWGVGSSGSNNNNVLFEHWDGSVWNVVKGGSGVTSGRLLGVTAISSSDIWAVGMTATQTLSEHWDGSQWTVVPTPSVGTYDELTSVSANSSNDVWASGYSISPTPTSFLLHWDGTSWTLVNAPPASNSALLAIKAFAPNDVWAVGYKDYDYNTGVGSNYTVHWDGTSFTEVLSPNPAPGANNGLSGLDGTSSTDLWAVGSSGNSFSTALHWDGVSWTVVTTTRTSASDGFYAVRTFSSSSVVAVGSSATGVLSERWDGTQWRVIPTPPVTGNFGFLFAISGRGSAVWTAGYQGYPMTSELFLTRSR